jgi:putative Mg2+ transporter-C (MgtC) family protein
MMIEKNFFETFFKIILTVLLCGLIGGERELRNKGAGLRTHILVGVGSTLIVLTSFFIFDNYRDVSVIDPTRMISGIVTGIGFLCAGTIIRGGNQIIGLTTAATLWVASGIGMAVGVGQYFAATAVTLTVFIVLICVKSLERKLKNTLHP